MTQTVANTNISNTFDYWRNRTNELATAMSNVVVTVNGGIPVGNAAIAGTYQANALYLSNSSSNVTITVPTSTQVANGQFYLNANGSWVFAPGGFNGEIQTTGTGVANIDYYPMATISVAEYTLSVKDFTANNFYATKLLTTHDGQLSYTTEYADILTNTAIGSFSTTTNTTHVILQFTPTSTNTFVKFVRAAI